MHHEHYAYTYMYVADESCRANESCMPAADESCIGSDYA